MKKALIIPIIALLINSCSIFKNNSAAEQNQIEKSENYTDKYFESYEIIKNSTPAKRFHYSLTSLTDKTYSFLSETDSSVTITDNTKSITLNDCYTGIYVNAEKERIYTLGDYSGANVSGGYRGVKIYDLNGSLLKSIENYNNYISEFSDRVGYSFDNKGNIYVGGISSNRDSLLFLLKKYDYQGNVIWERLLDILYNKFAPFYVKIKISNDNNYVALYAHDLTIIDQNGSVVAENIPGTMRLYTIFFMNNDDIGYSIGNSLYILKHAAEYNSKYCIDLKYRLVDEKLIFEDIQNKCIYIVYYDVDQLNVCAYELETGKLITEKTIPTDKKYSIDKIIKNYDDFQMYSKEGDVIHLKIDNKYY